MDTQSSKQIADLNRFFEPNPFNTGPPIPPLVLLAMIETDAEPMMEPKLDSRISTPELSPSPTSTAPSSPRSSRSALSLGHPEIRRIWEDPRFGPVVYDRTSPELNNLTSAYPFKEEEEYTLLDTPTFFKDGWAARDLFPSAGALNPLAQPFVPCFIVQEETQHSIGMDQASTFYGDSILLSPLELRDGPDGSLDSPSYLRIIEESSMYPVHASPIPFYSASVGYEDAPRSLDPPYPPGLPHPPQNAGKLRPRGEEPVSAACHEPLPPAYSSILIEALLPTHDHAARDALLQTLFDQVERWDLFTLRDLTSTLMVAALGNEHHLVLPCSEKACPNHGDERVEMEGSVGQDRPMLPEEVFYHVVAGFARIILQNSGQSIVDIFLVQVIDSIFSRFIFYFDANKPDSLNTYYKTHQSPPCISYIRSALSLSKIIAFLYQQSVVQRIDVNRCMMLLLQDLMSVEHLEVLRYIVLGSGMKFWDPPLSILSTSSPVLDGSADGVPASPLSNFAFPPVRRQAKAKLCGDVTMFCSKLDAYKIKRGQSGCVSLRGRDWGLSAESYKAMIKEVTDTVHQWEKELVKLFDQREELISTVSQSLEDD